MRKFHFLSLFALLTSLLISQTAFAGVGADGYAYVQSERCTVPSLPGNYVYTESEYCISLIPENGGPDSALYTYSTDLRKALGDYHEGDKIELLEQFENGQRIHFKGGISLSGISFIDEVSLVDAEVPVKTAENLTISANFAPNDGVFYLFPGEEIIFTSNIIPEGFSWRWNYLDSRLICNGFLDTTDLTYRCRALGLKLGSTPVSLDYYNVLGEKFSSNIFTVEVRDRSAVSVDTSTINLRDIFFQNGDQQDGFLPSIINDSNIPDIGKKSQDPKKLLQRVEQLLITDHADDILGDIQYNIGLGVFKYVGAAGAKEYFEDLDLLGNAVRKIKIHGLGEEAVCYATVQGRMESVDTMITEYFNNCAFRYDNILISENFSYAGNETMSETAMKTKMFEFARKHMTIFEKRLLDRLGAEYGGIDLYYTDIDDGVLYEEHENTTAEDTVSENGIPIPPAGFEDEVITRFDEYQNPFNDTDLDSLDGIAAAELYRRAVIGGYSDGGFKGDKLVNRAEGAKFLLLARFGVVKDVQGNGGFPDVLDDQWYGKYVVTAANKGIIEGYPNGLFKPGNQIKTAEFLKMLTKTFDIEEGLPNNYQDVPAGSWFETYAGVAARYGLFPGRDVYLDPGKDLTRDDVAVAIYMYLRNRSD